MPIKYINNDGAVNLSEAIVCQAAKDYLKAKKGLYLENPKNKNRIDRLRWKLVDATTFFRSKWYRALCSVDADYLIKKLDEEFDEWVKKLELED